MDENDRVAGLQELIRMVNSELETYRRGSREALVTFGTLCAATIFFVLDKLHLSSTAGGLWLRVALAAGFGFATFAVTLYLSTTRARALRVEEDRDKLLMQLAKLDIGPRPFRWPRNLKGSINRQYQALVWIFFLVTAVTFLAPIVDPSG